MPYCHFTADSTRISDRHPTNMRRQANVNLMLVYRLRRWPNIKQTLGQCLVFAGQLHRLSNAPAANWLEAPSWWEARGPGPTGPPLDPALYKRKTSKYVRMLSGLAWQAPNVGLMLF